jgi:hypothetical protein
MTESLVLNWTGVIPPADRELTAVEIKRRFGSIIQSGVRAFREDPQYLVDVAEDAVRARHQRALREAKAAIRAQNPGLDAASVTQAALCALEARGIVCPPGPAKRKAA